MAAIFLSGARFWAPDAPAAVKHGLALGTLSRSGGEMARVSSFSSGVPVTLGTFYRLNATPAGRQRCALLTT